MARRKFFGGVHPEYRKELTESLPIEVMPLPRRLIVHFAQNLGTAPMPIVKKGDMVKRGQVIGEPRGFISVPVHAPTSGTVQAIDVFPHPVGADMPAAVIIPDGKDEWAPGLDVERDASAFDAEGIVGALRDAGLVGMGGAAFPTHVKLSPPKEKPIDLLVVNGAECEPYLTADHRLMLEKPREIVEGASYFARALGVSKVIVAIERNKPDAAASMSAAIAGRPGFSVEALEVAYPQGAERQLIFSLTGRRVPAGGLPMDVGVLVQNVATSRAAYGAIRFNRPLTERVVCVSGRGVKTPKNLLLRIGTTFGDAIAFCGGELDSGKVIAGGPMMGVAQYSLDVPVSKGTSGIVLLRRNEVAQFVGDACIRCGRCVRACPMRLNPSILSVLVERLHFDDAGRHHVLDCIECGCCAYRCPSRRPMVHHFRRAKAEVRNKQAQAI
jgi:Na+-translocating ferredoxin:NAD+ oxidoreductase subunit C